MLPTPLPPFLIGEKLKKLASSVDAIAISKIWNYQWLTDSAQNVCLLAFKLERGFFENHASEKYKLEITDLDHIWILFLYVYTDKTEITNQLNCVNENTAGDWRQEVEAVILAAQ